MDAKFILYFVVPAAAGVGILLLGALLLIVAAVRKNKASHKETAHWRVTGGKVTAARVETLETRKNETQVAATYKPVVEYTYNVDNAEYRGDNFFPGETAYAAESDARELLAQYSLNSYVPVHYNPANPSESSLGERAQTSNFVYLAGWTLTAFGICVCCFTSFMTIVILGGVQ